MGAVYPQGKDSFKGIPKSIYDGKKIACFREKNIKLKQEFDKEKHLKAFQKLNTFAKRVNWFLQNATYDDEESIEWKKKEGWENEISISTSFLTTTLREFVKYSREEQESFFLEFCRQKHENRVAIRLKTSIFQLLKQYQRSPDTHIQFQVKDVKKRKEKFEFGLTGVKATNDDIFHDASLKLIGCKSGGVSLTGGLLYGITFSQYRRSTYTDDYHNEYTYTYPSIPQNVSFVI
jgi:hypothetical protein